LRTALKLQPSLWNAQALLGMTELRSGNRHDAKPLMEESFGHVQDPNLRSQAGLDLIKLYYESKELDRVVDVLRALQGSSASDPVVLYNAYRTYSDLAARSLATLAQVAPESAQMHEILGQALTSQDNFPGAIVQYRKALEINPQISEIHVELGQMILTNSLDESGRQQAEKEFASALATDPNNAECEYMLGEIAWLRSKPQDAFTHYSRALEMRPEFVDAQIAVGRALTTLGQTTQALAHLEEAIRLDPQNEVAHYRLGQAYRKLGRTADAERESASFRKLRDSHGSARSLYEQFRQRPVREQTIDPSEPQ